MLIDFAVILVKYDFQKQSLGVNFENEKSDKKNNLQHKQGMQICECPILTWKEKIKKT